MGTIRAHQRTRSIGLQPVTPLLLIVLAVLALALWLPDFIDLAGLRDDCWSS